MNGFLGAPSINCSELIKEDGPNSFDTGPIMPFLSGELIIQMYQTIRRPVVSAKDGEPYQPNNFDADGPMCRICRSGNEVDTLIACPCRCTGSVGFIHIKCLRRWIRFRGTKTCEICRNEYLTETDKRNFWALFASFFRRGYFGLIASDVISMTTIFPLVYLTSHQLVHTVEVTSKESLLKALIFAPTVFAATSIYFILYFCWALSCMFRIKHVIRHWWSFGDDDDNEEYTNFLDLDRSDIFEIEM